MQYVHSNFFKKITLAVAITIGLGATVGYYMWQVQQPWIYEFEEERDTQSILDVFKKNWYWLVASDDYSPELMLKRRARYYNNPLNWGQLHIKVLRKKQDFIGFVAYYLEGGVIGHILFVAVKEEYRGKRYAEQLMQYALDSLKKEGARVIRLVTRPTNLPAQALYKRLGFIETHHDDEYVFFTYSMNGASLRAQEAPSS